jgi:hypothetical protein
MAARHQIAAIPGVITLAREGAAPGRLFEYTSVRNLAAPRNARATGAESRPSTGRTDPERSPVIAVIE